MGMRASIVLVDLLFFLSLKQCIIRVECSNVMCAYVDVTMHLFCSILEAGQTEAVVRDLAARHFQLELFELAVKQNVIICLGTGKPFVYRMPNLSFFNISPDHSFGAD